MRKLRSYQSHICDKSTSLNARQESSVHAIVERDNMGQPLFECSGLPEVPVHHRCHKNCEPVVHASYLPNEVSIFVLLFDNSLTHVPVRADRNLQDIRFLQLVIDEKDIWAVGSFLFDRLYRRIPHHHAAIRTHRFWPVLP